MTFSATEGIVAANVTVATFTDPGGAGDATNYIASIDWGDGTPADMGLVAANGSDGFDVIASHTYAEHGTNIVAVTVQDEDGSNGSTNLVEVVLDAALAATGATVAPVEGIPFSGVVASFADANPNGKSSDFLASIDWGDGTISGGTISTNSSGGFDVTSAHTYLEEGTFSIAVLVTDIGGSTAAAAGTAHVSDAPLTATGVTIHPVESIPFAGVVATFTDANANSAAGDFLAFISWGDGASDLGTVSATGAGGFEVTGAHTYADENSFAIIVTILDIGGSLAEAGSTAEVADAPLTVGGLTIAAIEGAPFSGLVATFTDANTNATLDEFTATVDWGDGSTSAGVVSTNETNGFSVSDSHTYQEEGAFAITVTIHDSGGSTAAAGSTANVSDALLTSSGVAVSAVEGAPFTAQVATLTDANPFATAGDFSVTIDWGDGIISTGAVTTAESGFNVSGSHTYVEEGTYGITVNILDKGGSTTSSGCTATVADAPLTSIGRLITPVENTAFVAVVASFVDADPLGTNTDYTATIAWGDGVISSGSIIANGSSKFDVLGSHKYADQGYYPIVVSIQDAGGASTTASSMADTVDMPILATGTTITAVKGEAFTTVIANCMDTDPTPESEVTYTCIINWGDGSTSTGTVTQGETGVYEVSGSHTYAKAGSYVVLATIDDKQNFNSTTARSTAIVSEPCADNATAQVRIKATRPQLVRRLGQVKQVVTVKNIGGTPIAGPISIVLDNLHAGEGSIDLFNKDGETTTACAAPLGSPYKNLVLPKNQVLRPGATKTIILFFDSTQEDVTYTARVLAGSGAR